MDKIEKHLTAIYENIQKQLPKMHHLTFSVATYDTGKSKLYGFLHSDEQDCKLFYSITELNNIIQKEIVKRKRRTILCRNFKGVL